MKKVFVALLLLITTITFGQEKVLLRFNYEKDDRYETHMTMNQDMGPAKMKMEMKMETLVEEKKADKSFDTKLGFTYVASSVTEGGEVKVNYNSDMKVEDMTEDQKKLHADMESIKATKIFVNLSELGDSKLIKMEPQMEGVTEFTNQMTTVTYPEEAVSVGSTWENSHDIKGMTMRLIYTVKEITATKVIAEMKGEMALFSSAVIYGDLEIDKKTGVQSKANINMEISMGGISMKNSTNATTVKL